MSSRAKAAVEYTRDFCQVIIVGIGVYIEYLEEAKKGRAHLVEEGELYSCCPDMCDEDDIIPFAFNQWGYCIDDISGHQLPMDFVKEGRRSEMEGGERVSCV